LLGIAKIDNIPEIPNFFQGLGTDFYHRQGGNDKSKEIKDLQGQVLFIKRIICNFARFHELEATVNKILTI